MQLSRLLRRVAAGENILIVIVGVLSLSRGSWEITIKVALGSLSLPIAHCRVARGRNDPANGGSRLSQIQSFYGK
jgi:hypothetical protein